MAKRRKRKPPKKPVSRKKPTPKTPPDKFSERVERWTKVVAESTDTYDERLGEVVPIWRPKEKES